MKVWQGQLKHLLAKGIQLLVGKPHGNNQLAADAWLYLMFSASRVLR